MYWRKIALALTTWENYRLERDFRAALIIRMFIFQFINSYFALFYIAFVRRYGVRYTEDIYDRCEPDECMQEMRELILFILIYNLVVGAAIEMWLPVQKKLLRQVFGTCARLTNRQVAPNDGVSFELDMGEIGRKVRRSGKGSLTKEEAQAYDDHLEDMELVEQYERPPLKSVHYGLGATFYEYNELCLQFGYIIMFSAALPAGALFALANNFLEIRLDALKTLETTRRVAPTLTDGIGAWRVVIESLSYFGVLTNLLILAFTSDFLPLLGVHETWERLGFVVVVEHLLLVLKLGIDYSSPDVPSSVRKSVARDEWMAKHF